MCCINRNGFVTMKIVVSFGTRPELIKLAPIIRELKLHKNIDLHVINTGQHKEMLDPLLDFFDIEVNEEFECMTSNQGLSELAAMMLSLFDKSLKQIMPDILVVQGDTTTTFAGAVSAFYLGIHIAHVEAGLRTFNMRSPFPEEFNRQAVTKVASLHFAATEAAKVNLINEGINEVDIDVTGNTVIDSLFYSLEKSRDKSLEDIGLGVLQAYRRIVLVTGHRRENFGIGINGILDAIRSLSESYPDVAFVYPVHMNPNVKVPVFEKLSGIANVYLVEPLDYVSFCRLMEECYIIITDSGGVQEEAPSLGKPLLVTRDTTERQEAVDFGVAELVGVNTSEIVKHARALLDDPNQYMKMVKKENPFGDGFSAKRIVEKLVVYK